MIQSEESLKEINIKQNKTKQKKAIGSIKKIIYLKLSVIWEDRG